jgi:hypothetical protein
MYRRGLYGSFSRMRQRGRGETARIEGLGPVSWSMLYV